MIIPLVSSFVFYYQVTTNTGPYHIYMVPESVHNFNVNTRGVAEVYPDVMKLCLELGVKKHKPSDTVDRAIEDFFKKGGKVRYSKQIINKKYTDLDVTKLFMIIPNVTEIREDGDQNFKSLWKSLEEIKEDRNNVMHVDDGTYSKDTIKSISEKVNNSVDLAGKCFNLMPHEVLEIKERFEKQIDDIRDPKQAREKELKCAIKKSVIEANHRKWAPKHLELVKFDTLPVIDIEIRRCVIFHAINFEVLSNHNMPTMHDLQNHKTIACSDILNVDKIPNVCIIEGDPGSGKSTFLRMMSFEFCNYNCKKCPPSIFTQMASYEIMMVINCRDREEIRSFWQHFHKHYPEISQEYHKNQDAVISSLKETKMIITIDGLDEANEASKALIRDVIHQLAGSEAVRLLITTRPGFSQDVMKQFDRDAIPYLVLNILQIVNNDDQEHFIRRIFKHIPNSKCKVEDIMKNIRAKQFVLNFDFRRPLGLMLFIALFLTFPQKTKEVTNELSLMQLLFEMYLNNMSERMPDDCRDRQHSMRILKIFGQKCLGLIQNNIYHIDQYHFDKLTAECCKVNELINVERVLSCVLLKRKCSQTTLTATRDFYHHSQQEYFASRVLTDTLAKTHTGTLLSILQDLTVEEVHEADLRRLVQKPPNTANNLIRGISRDVFFMICIISQ